MVDARDSKSRDSDVVSVRVRPSVPNLNMFSESFLIQSCLMSVSMSSAQCIFCKIIAQEVPASIIAQNEHALAFPDRSPLAPVHILIVPRRHIESMNSLSAQDAPTIAGMVALIQQLAQTHGNPSDHGFNIEINTGASAGQSVFHMHWHFKAGR